MSAMNVIVAAMVLIAASVATAQVTIEAEGAVGFTSISSGPYAGAIVGAPVRLIMEVEEEGFEVDPGHYEKYELILDSFVMTWGEGAAGISYAGEYPHFDLQNDFPGVDGFHFFERPMDEPGYWMAFECFGNNGDFLDSTDITQEAGTYGPQEFEWVDWHVYGGGGELWADFSHVTIHPVSAPCPADLDGDGAVGVTDFLALLAAWGPNPGHPADLDGDRQVGVTDFLMLLSLWGPCP